MNKGHNGPTAPGKGALPVNAREALQWFCNTVGLYLGSSRGLFISDWTEEREAWLESTVINLKSRGFNPLSVAGDDLYKQADYLWKESRANTQFGRPLASKLELDLVGSDVAIIDNLVAPENSRHLWYLWSHLLYPRATAGKPTIITTPLSLQEFSKYGQDCNDPDFCGKAVNWEKILWLIEASMITVDVLKTVREDGLPPMLKAEYELYTAMKERGLEVVPQHVLGDFMLDFALMDRDRRLDIEVDVLSSLGGVELQRQEAKRNLVLFADGWQVLKLTTCEIQNNKAGCIDAIDDVWRSGRKRSPAGRLQTGNMVTPIPELPVDDDVQVSAITYGGGPVAICGGAGTGKSTCIIQRVAYLIAQGIPPENMLVITHSTDNQRAMKRALEGVLEKQSAQKLNVCSWQDLGLKILKENLPLIRRKPPLKIEPSPQKIVQRLLAKVKKEIDPAKLELSVDLDEFYIAAVISMYKAHLISPKQAKEDASSYSEEIIARIYQQLEDQLQKANRIDRDDAISMAVQVLLDNPELRARYGRQFEFVLIDEYHDATVAQDMLGRLLAAPQDNLFLVGDEDETVFESKNACPELFTEVSLRMPHARCFALERNWRSHPAIVDHSRQLISHAQRRRIQREFISAWGQAPATAIIGPAALVDEYDEANWVANEIQLLADTGRNYGDMAILFRHHVYATIMEEALDNRGVRFQASNPINNFIPDEVEDMLAFLKLVIDPDGPRARESFERVCSLRSREIDPKLSATIAGFAEANNLSYLKAVEIYSEATCDQSCRELEQLVRAIRTMHQEKMPPAETIALIRRTQRLNDYYRNVKVPAGVNYEPLKKLTQLEEESRTFKTIADFVKHISNQKQSGTGVADAGVQVLPILDSKGCEFPIVFMVGMAQGIFPAETAIDFEEERRICYVGFTRAKELLYLSFPQMFSGAPLQPSQFLVEARLMAGAVYAQVPQPPVEVVPEVPVQQPQIPIQPAAPIPVQPAVQAPPVQIQEPAPTPIRTPQPVQQPPTPVQPPAPVPVQPQPIPVQPPAPVPVQPQPIPIQPPAPVPVQPQPIPVQPAAQVPVQPQPIPVQPAAQVQPAINPAAIGQPEAPIDPFQVYTGDNLGIRPGMPSLPRSKKPPVVSGPEPAQNTVAPPVVPASLEQQVVQSFAQQQVEQQHLPPEPPAAVHSSPSPPQWADTHVAQQAPLPPFHPQYEGAPGQEYAYQAPEHHDLAPGHPLCPSCHSPLEANARFCSECGYSLPARVPACPTCAAPLEAMAKFCGECGMSLTAPVAGDSSQVSQNMLRMQDLKDKQHGWVNKIWKMLES